jgi:peptidoglycan hydrolase-like protein with peptidoglycan-binding domain
MRRYSVLIIAMMVLLASYGVLQAQQPMQSGKQMSEKVNPGAPLFVGPHTIEHVQKKLQEQGYKVTPNGVWNQETREALMECQKAQGLAVTGVIDLRTFTKLGLQQSMASDPPESWGNQSGSKQNWSQQSKSTMYGNLEPVRLYAGPETVRDVLTALSTKTSGKVNTQAGWNEEASKELASFQRANGLDVTGNLNFETLKALGVEKDFEQPGNAGQQTERQNMNQQSGMNQGMHQQSGMMNQQSGMNQGMNNQGMHSQGMNQTSSSEKQGNNQGNRMGQMSSKANEMMSPSSAEKNYMSKGMLVPVYISPTSVRQVQQKLAAIGDNPGKPDGEWGSKTEKAVRTLQEQRGLSVTGDIDLETLGTLGVARSYRDLYMAKASGQAMNR